VLLRLEGLRHRALVCSRELHRGGEPNHLPKPNEHSEGLKGDLTCKHELEGPGFPPKPGNEKCAVHPGRITTLPTVLHELA